MPQGLLPVTLELRGVRDVSPEQAEQDADAIISALQESGYITADEAAVSVEVAAPVIGGDELVSVASGGEDLVGVDESGTGLGARVLLRLPMKAGLLSSVTPRVRQHHHLR